MMNFHEKLPIPKDIKEQYPLTEEMINVKKQRDEDIKAVFRGDLDKFLLIIGPCSADHYDSVLDYISRLKKVQEKKNEKRNNRSSIKIQR